MNKKRTVSCSLLPVIEPTKSNLETDYRWQWHPFDQTLPPKHLIRTKQPLTTCTCNHETTKTREIIALKIRRSPGEGASGRRNTSF